MCTQRMHQQLNYVALSIGAEHKTGGKVLTFYGDYDVRWKKRF